jgi:hypothetical protein
VVGSFEEFWSTISEEALYPLRVPMIEALLWIGEPLSAIELVDVLDGYLSMWESLHHLGALTELGVMEPTLDDRSGDQQRAFEVPYRLKIALNADS